MHPGSYPHQTVTALNELRISVYPDRFKQDSVSNPAWGIAGVLGAIPIVGWLLAILVGVPVHIARKRKQRRIEQAIQTGEISRPWNWRILLGGPDPQGAWTETWVWGDLVAGLGLTPDSNGHAWVKGMEPTREAAEAKARRAYEYLTAHMASAAP